MPMQSPIYAYMRLDTHIFADIRLCMHILAQIHIFTPMYAYIGVYARISHIYADRSIQAYVNMRKYKHIYDYIHA